MADKTISLRYPAAGDYSVMFAVEDNLTHCVSHASQAVTVNDTARLVAANLTQAICLGNAITAVPIEYSYATISVSPELPEGLTMTHHGLGKDTIFGTPVAFQAASDYIITATNADGCANKSLSFSLTVNDTVKLTVENEMQVVCLGEAIDPIAVTYTNATITALPLVSGLSITAADGTDTISGTPALSGIYNYTITAVSGQGCASKTHGMQLTVNPRYEVTDAKSVCASQLPYQWNGVWFTEAGVQEATLQTINGCDSTVTMTLTVEDYAREILNKEICQGESYQFGDSVFTTTGVHYDTLTRSDGLCDSIAELHLTVNDTVKLQASGLAQEVCLGNAITAVPFEYSNAVLHVTPTLAQGLELTVHGAGKDSIRGVPSDAGAYTYTVTAESTNGCTAYNKTETVEILVYPAFALTGNNTDTNYCLNVGAKELTVNVTNGSINPAHFQWYKNGVAISGANSNSYTPTTDVAGEYSYSVKVDNGCGNDSVGVADVTVYPAFALNNDNTSKNYCLNSESDALVVSVTSGSINPARIQWYKDGALISGATSGSYTPTTGEAGEHDYSVKVDNGCGDDSVFVAHIGVYPLQVVTTVGEDTAYCKDMVAEMLSVLATGGNGSYSYQWYANGVAIDGATDSRYTPSTADAASDTMFSVKVTGNCSSDSMGVARVTVHDTVKLSVASSDQILCLGNAINDIDIEYSNTVISVAPVLPEGVILTGHGLGKDTIKGKPVATLPETTYTIKATSNTGCAAYDKTFSFKLTVKDTVKLIVENETQNLCLGQAIEPIPVVYKNSTVNALSLASGLSITAADGTDTISGAPDAAGNYVYTVTASSNTGCDATDKTKTITITVNDTLVPVLTSNTPVCLGGDVVVSETAGNLSDQLHGQSCDDGRWYGRQDHQLEIPCGG